MNAHEVYWSNYGKFLDDEGPPPVWFLNGKYNERHLNLDIFDAPDMKIDIPDIGTAGPYNFWDAADHVMVPPFTTVNIYRDLNYQGQTAKLVGPKFHPLGDYGMVNAVSSAKIKATKPWSDAMIPCCSQQISGKWCGTWDPSRDDSVCDARMKEWCSKTENKDKQECACINSSIKYLPSCFDTKCTNNPLAYKTKDMKSVVDAGCPDIMECNQYIALSDEAKQNLVNRTQMEQNCTSVRNNNIDNINNTNPIPGYTVNNNQPVPYVPTGPTDPYVPPSSYPYAGSTQPNAYNNPYGGGNYSSNTPFNTSSSTGDDSGKIMGMDPMVLLIIIVVAFAFIVAMYMFFNRNQNNQGYFDQNQNNQGQNRYPPQGR